MTNTFLYFWSFIFGIVFGSFLNVLILRDDRRKTIWNGRSECLHCKRTLSWYELIPVISYLIQGGKCRGCKKPVSIQYPLVELLIGLLAVVSVWLGVVEQGSYLLAISIFISFFFLFAVAGIDIRTMTIPLDYTVLGGSFGALGQVLSKNHSIGEMVLGCLLGAMSIISVIFIWKVVTKKEGMGSGDIWVAGAVGASVGYPLAVVSLVAAVYSGAIIGVAALLLKRKKMESQVPFGPFLVFGGIFALIWGESIIRWYLETTGMVY